MAIYAADTASALEPTGLAARRVNRPRHELCARNVLYIKHTTRLAHAYEPPTYLQFGSFILFCKLAKPNEAYNLTS